MKKLGIKEKVVLVLVLVIIAAFSGFFTYTYRMTERAKTPYEDSGSYAMGTYVTQKMYGTVSNPSAVAAKAYNEIKKLENRISWRVSGSDIRRVNENSGNEVKVNSKTTEIISICLDVAEKSNGMFDPTILPIVRLWGFDSDYQKIPDSLEFDKAYKLIDYKRIQFSPYTNSIKLDDGQSIDLGAVGKGAGCQAAIEVFRESEGVTGALVSVGGSIGVYGEKAGGENWEIGVRDPRGKKLSDILGTLKLMDGFISTSGDYEKFFVEDSKYFHHILSPETGYPSNSGIISATVVCDNGALSDALSTACVLLGRDPSLKLLSEYSADAILVDEQKNIFITNGISNEFSLTAEGYDIIVIGEISTE